MPMFVRRALAAALVAPVLAAASASGQLAVGSDLQTSLSQVGVAFDPATSSVWVYASFGADIRRFSTTGTPLGVVPRPGGSANDADLEIAPVAFTMGTTQVPAGTLLYIDGESGPAEIYAINPVTGALLGSLNTQFGVSHVVGGAFHPARGTFFLVQDKVPGGLAASVIAEINPITGAVLNSFRIAEVRPDFTVNFGDIDVAGNGNLLVVSSDESSIGEFTPGGAFVALRPLPAGVTSLCGIGFDDTTCDIWVASTSSRVTRLTGGAVLGLCPATCGTSDFDGDGDAGTDSDIEAFFACLAGTCCPTCGTSDFDADGDAGTDADIEAFFRVLAGGNC